jgi:hypothetical protein
MRCVLSYFKPYFDPSSKAPLLNHSAGQIAQHLYRALDASCDVRYFGGEETPCGLKADLFIGHFWSFAEMCERNSFDIKVAFYSVSDPEATRQLMETLARRYDVPVPYWDLPPAGFDHERTMELADLVFLVGNTNTLQTFPRRWHSKIRLFNYSIDTELYSQNSSTAKSDEFCYVATHNGLRKGFMDILQTWAGIDEKTAKLHAIGHLDPPWDLLLERHNTGSIIHHGWIDSDALEYRQIIKDCKFAHIPTCSEGQMGTLLEVIFSGCIPITTRASGIDDHLLEHCLVVDPLNVAQQRSAIHEALSWSDQEFAIRRERLREGAHRYHNWAAFEDRVGAEIKTLQAPQTA